MKDFIKRNKEYLIAIAMIAALFLLWLGVSKKMIANAAEVSFKEYRCGDVVVKIDDSYLSSDLVPVLLVYKDYNSSSWMICCGSSYTLTEWSGIQGPYTLKLGSSTQISSGFKELTGQIISGSTVFSSFPSNGRVSASAVYVIKGKQLGTDAYTIEHASESVTQNVYDPSIPSPVVLLNYDAARKPTSFSVQTDPLNQYLIKVSIKHRSLLNEEIPDYEEAFQTLGELQYTSEANDMRSILSILEPRFYYPGVMQELTLPHNSSASVTFPEILDESTYYIDSWYIQNTWVSTTHMASLVRYVTGRISSIGFTYVDESNGHYGKTYTINYDLKGNIISQSETITAVPTDGEYAESLEQRIDELLQQNENLQQQVEDLQYAGDEIAGMGEDGNILNTFQNILSTVTGIFRAMPQFFALLATLLSFLPQPIMYLIYFGLLCVVIASIYHAIRG